VIDGAVPRDEARADGARPHNIPLFREGSPDLEEFRKHGELAKMASRIGVGPDGMTIRSSDAAVIEYLAAK
jgi:hypothetical protein